MDLLPSTTYQVPPRRAGGRQLNTIIEEPEFSSKASVKSDSDTDGSERTVTGKPAGWNPKLFVAAPRKGSRLATIVTNVEPAEFNPSPCSSLGSELERGSTRGSVNGSENGTIFSDDTCPSLTSDPTSFATDSSRNSLASNRSSIVSSKSNRNRYPALLIPRSSWDLSAESPVKELILGMAQSPKINLPAAMVSRQPVPAEAHTPSLGGSSVASESPCLPGISGPGTPNLHQLSSGDDDEPWVEPAMTHTLNPLEIALDDEHSIILSPADAHGPSGPPSAVIPVPLSGLLSPRDAEWGGMMSRFPAAGADIAQAPALPAGLASMMQERPTDDNGVILSNDALMTLNRLTREVSPDEKSVISRFQEMRERSGASPPPLRPKSWDLATPATEASFSKLSDYSYASLSIPSPGGFFSSLKGNARHTWCIEKPSRENSVPTSAIAENFYFNWDTVLGTKETVLTVEDTSTTEGPPTARQNSFDSAITGADERPGSRSSEETDDLYGVDNKIKQFPSPNTVQYEEAYEEELKQASEANLDRTSSWLSAQTSYLSALRESNPINSPADYLASPHPGFDEDRLSRSNTIDSNIRKTVRFLEEARSATAVKPPPNVLTTDLVNAVASPKSGQTSPDSAPSPSSKPKESIFLSAFNHLLNDPSFKYRSNDTFIHSSARLELIRAMRIALPQRHLDSILGQYWLEAPQRPKYSGPFNSNPRATGIFDRSAESLMYEAVEKEQAGMRHIYRGVWETDALRSLYAGRLLASQQVCKRLSNKATVPLTDPKCVGAKRLRILDLGGTASGSWGWTAAAQWPNVKVYTVITKEQSTNQRPAGVAKPTGPDNHRTVSVPHLWQLPFKSNHFDVISARSLHMLLRSEPVPGVKEIDEWDLALRECKRVLKPGGTLDFLVMDSSVARASTLGEKMSVEFGFELKKRGYERDAATKFVAKMEKHGFIGTKRTWMFMPMGKKDEHPDVEFLAAPRPVSEVSTISKIVRQYEHCEAVQGPVGSMGAVADLVGVLGQRMWEEWVVKLRMEAGWARSRLLEGIDEVLQEGKEAGSGWRVCVGFCRKPRQSTEEKGKGKGKKRPVSLRAEIKIGLAEDEERTPVPTPLPTPATVISVGREEREKVCMEMKERRGHESLLSVVSRARGSGEVGIVPFMIQGSPT
jgi:SAM-dependent methyltransferase